MASQPPAESPAAAAAAPSQPPAAPAATTLSLPPPPPILSSTNPTHVTDTCRATNLTPAAFADLRALAEQARARAHCPYSRYAVGAALLTAAGGLVGGANVEVASYPVGTCAERVALGRAVADGMEGFVALAVVTEESPLGPGSPCGMCRQFIREFCDLMMPVLMFDTKGNFVCMRVHELLPYSFGPASLNVQSV